MSVYWQAVILAPRQTPPTRWMTIRVPEGHSGWYYRPDTTIESLLAQNPERIWIVSDEPNRFVFFCKNARWGNILMIWEWQ